MSNNGSIGYAFFQPIPFTCTHDVNPLYLKGHDLNPYIALFLCTVIEMDKYRWTYGRKWRPARMPSSLIKLPITELGTPDWNFMESFIKSRPYSKLLQTPKEESIPTIPGKNEIISNILTYPSPFDQDSIAAEPFEVYQRTGLYETILIGCYRDKKHLEWILSKNIYNIRLGKRKGSTKGQYYLFDKTKVLHLYDINNPSDVSTFRITGIREMTGTELKELNYPRKSPGKSYMTFSIIRIDYDPKNAVDVVGILNSYPDHIKGTPVFIEPDNI